MDKLKRKRTTHRAAFSRALNALNEALSESTDKRKILLSFQVLEDAMSELTVTTNEYLDILYDTPDIVDEIIEEEQYQAENYKKKFLEAKFSVVELQSETSVNQPPRRSGSTAPSDIKRTYKLSTIELVKFNGDVREWLHFWSMFKKIHEDPDVAKEDKFQYLKQAMVTEFRADVLVKSFPPTAENYDKVIDSLKNRFGREDLQIEVYVRELLQLVLQNAISQNKNIVLSSLYDKLESYLRSLDSLGVTTDKCAAMLFPLVESSLPEELLRVWQRSNLSTSTEANVQAKDRLSQLVKFLEGEVQNEVRISMAVKGFDLKSSSEVDKQKKNKESYTKDTPSAASLLTVKGQKKQCVFCESSDHASAVCDDGKKMTYEGRKEIAKKKNCCFKCLNIGHTSFKCRVFLNCDKCSRHLTLMCPGDDKKNDSSSETVRKECNLASFCNDPEVFMQTLRVKLFNGPREVIVRAVIDTGSQRSYITKEAAAKVDYEPISEQLVSHSLFGGEKSDAELHKKYLIRLRSLDNNYACNFRTLDQSVICEDVPSVKSGIWVDELKKLDVEITDMKGTNEPVSILIGADVAGKLLTGQRHILECGLVAMETYLGWTLMGSVPNEEKRRDAVMIATNMFVRNTNISDLWSLDVLGIKDPIEIKSQKERENEIKENFLNTVKINKEKRYDVKLPWFKKPPRFE